MSVDGGMCVINMENAYTANCAFEQSVCLSAEGSDPSASYVRYIQLLITLREYACYEGPTGMQPIAYEWRRVGEPTTLPGTVDGETIAFVCNAAAARANAAESALQRAVPGDKEAAKNAYKECKEASAILALHPTAATTTLAAHIAARVSHCMYAAALAGVSKEEALGRQAAKVSASYKGVSGAEGMSDYYHVRSCVHFARHIYEVKDADKMPSVGKALGYLNVAAVTVAKLGNICSDVRNGSAQLSGELDQLLGKWGRENTIAYTQPIVAPSFDAGDTDPKPEAKPKPPPGVSLSALIGTDEDPFVDIARCLDIPRPFAAIHAKWDKKLKELKSVVKQHESATMVMVPSYVMTAMIAVQNAVAKANIITPDPIFVLRARESDLATAVVGCQNELQALRRVCLPEDSILKSYEKRIASVTILAWDVADTIPGLASAARVDPASYFNEVGAVNFPELVSHRDHIVQESARIRHVMALAETEAHHYLVIAARANDAKLNSGHPYEEAEAQVTALNEPASDFIKKLTDTWDARYSEKWGVPALGQYVERLAKVEQATAMVNSLAGEIEEEQEKTRKVVIPRLSLPAGGPEYGCTPRVVATPRTPATSTTPLMPATPTPTPTPGRRSLRVNSAMMAGYMPPPPPVIVAPAPKKRSRS